MKLQSGLLFSALLVCSQAAMSNELDSGNPPSHVADGTYEISICQGSCSSDAAKVTGILVVDKTKKSFPKKDEATQFVIESSVTGQSPNYCYFFDPANKYNKDSMFGDDSVNFGEMETHEDSPDVVPFYLDSPDFRLWTVVQKVDGTGFTGSWSSAYAGSPGGGTTEHVDYHFEGKRISPPDSSVCYDAIPVHRKQDLQMFCVVHSDKCASKPASR